MEGGFYAPVRSDGNTRLPPAWTQVCSIKDFILQDVRKESEPQQWKWLTNPRDNATVASRYLIDVEHHEFATLCVDDSLIAWQNGVYSISHNVFWPYADVEAWHEHAEASSRKDERKDGARGIRFCLLCPMCAVQIVDQTFRMRRPDDMTWQCEPNA